MSTAPDSMKRPVAGGGRWDHADAGGGPVALQGDLAVKLEGAERGGAKLLSREKNRRIACLTHACTVHTPALSGLATRSAPRSSRAYRLQDGLAMVGAWASRPRSAKQALTRACSAATGVEGSDMGRHHTGGRARARPGVAPGVGAGVSCRRAPMHIFRAPLHRLCPGPPLAWPLGQLMRASRRSPRPMRGRSRWRGRPRSRRRRRRGRWLPARWLPERPAEVQVSEHGRQQDCAARRRACSATSALTARCAISRPHAWTLFGGASLCQCAAAQQIESFIKAEDAANAKAEKKAKAKKAPATKK